MRKQIKSAHFVPRLTSLMRCLTGLWPPPTPHTLSRRIISLFMLSSTAARSKATLGENKGTQVERDVSGAELQRCCSLGYFYLTTELKNDRIALENLKGSRQHCCLRSVIESGRITWRARSPLCLCSCPGTTLEGCGRRWLWL